MSDLQAAIDRLAGLVENGHLLANMSAEALLGSVADSLAAAREARLAAELRAEGLREALLDVQPYRTESDGHCRHCDARIHQEMHRETCPFAALDVAPPDLGPLRSYFANVGALLDAFAEFGAEPSWIGEAVQHAEAAHDAALAAYPALDPGAEPAGEVPRG